MNRYKRRRAITPGHYGITRPAIHIEVNFKPHPRALRAFYCIFTFLLSYKLEQPVPLSTRARRHSPIKLTLIYITNLASFLDRSRSCPTLRGREGTAGTDRRVMEFQVNRKISVDQSGVCAGGNVHGAGVRARTVTRLNRSAS